MLRALRLVSRPPRHRDYPATVPLSFESAEAPAAEYSRTLVDVPSLFHVWVPALPPCSRAKHRNRLLQLLLSASSSLRRWALRSIDTRAILDHRLQLWCQGRRSGAQV